MPEKIPSILRKILARKKVRLRQDMQRVPRAELEAAIPGLPAPRDFAAAVGGSNSINIIAEIKHRSPSAGVIREPFSVGELQLAYEQGGADAFSVLTEEDYFGGSLEHLLALRRATQKPILRKDFLVSPYQIFESRAAGADAVLLIAAVLSTRRLTELLALCAELGLAVLVEVHTLAEMLAVRRTPAAIIGINNRDLHSFRVDLDTSVALSPYVPEGRIAVSESGIRSRKDIEKLGAAGIHAFLIGEHLMRSENIPSAIRELKGGQP